MDTKHTQVMNEAKAELDTITDVVPEGSRIIYFDYPLHFNVGDQLIYLGTLEFFRKKSYEVIGYYSEHNCKHNDLPEIEGDVVVLLHGGGNFGDLYHKHQEFRERILKKYLSNRVVVLPQTIFFESDEVRNKSALLFRNHPDVHVYARDERSFFEASLFSDKCYLTPDMAQYLWGEELICKLSYDKDRAKDRVLFQQRIDFENAGYSASSGYEDAEEFDWYELIPKWCYWSCSVLSFMSKITKNHPVASKVINFLWEKVSIQCIVASASKLNESCTFVTTRLHGHIFANLLAHPNTTLDNNYGKIQSYSDVWSVHSDIVTTGDVK